MLTLFKGELTLQELLWGLPRKRLLELRTVRRDQLIAEQKEMDRITRERESNNIRNQIMAK